MTTPGTAGAAARARHPLRRHVLADLLGFSETFDIGKYGSAGAPLHDPNVIAYLLRPDLYAGRHINVAIECASPLTRGMTVADWWRVTDRPANVTFIRDVDAPGFYDAAARADRDACRKAAAGGLRRALPLPYGHWRPH